MAAEPAAMMLTTMSENAKSLIILGFKVILCSISAHFTQIPLNFVPSSKSVSASSSSLIQSNWSFSFSMIMPAMAPLASSIPFKELSSSCFNCWVTPSPSSYRMFSPAFSFSKSSLILLEIDLSRCFSWDLTAPETDLRPDLRESVSSSRSSKSSVSWVLVSWRARDLPWEEVSWMDCLACLELVSCFLRVWFLDRIWLM